jgi:hypothetical protein
VVRDVTVAQKAEKFSRRLGQSPHTLQHALKEIRQLQAGCGIFSGRRHRFEWCPVHSSVELRFEPVAWRAKKKSTRDKNLSLPGALATGKKLGICSLSLQRLHIELKRAGEEMDREQKRSIMAS